MLVNIGNSDVIYGMAYFLPTIVHKLGYSGQSANLLTIPVYVAASVNVVVMCWLSDWWKRRSTLILGLMGVEILGFVMALVGSIEGGVPGVVYAGCFLATGCCYAAFVLNVVSSLNLLFPSRWYVGCANEMTDVGNRQSRARIQARSRRRYAHRPREFLGPDGVEFLSHARRAAVCVGPCAGDGVLGVGGGGGIGDEVYV